MKKVNRFWLLEEGPTTEMPMVSRTADNLDELVAFGKLQLENGGLNHRYVVLEARTIITSEVTVKVQKATRPRKKKALVGTSPEIPIGQRCVMHNRAAVQAFYGPGNDITYMCLDCPGVIKKWKTVDSVKAPLSEDEG